MSRILTCAALVAAVLAFAAPARAQYPPRYCPQQSATVLPTPPPIPYTGARYSFYTPSYYYTNYDVNYNSPTFTSRRYRNPGPYYYAPERAYTPSYYGYYYTPGFFRY